MSKKATNLRNFFFRNFLFLLSLVIIFLSAVLFFYSLKDTLIFYNEYPEINYLQESNLDFNGLKRYFQKLADKKGAVYAYEVLKKAPMPPNTDMHLLGHAVGEVLYQQKGADGMQFCTADFRNACSHTIVVGLFLDQGEAALKQITESCKKAPGGSGAYLMCHHGLGHGVLAFTNYDLKKTVDLCQKTGTGDYNFQESSECIGGAIMEQISGGDHDKKTWAKKREVNLKVSDPLYPCNSEIIPESAKKLCYIYLTPHLFRLAGDNPGGRPTDETITQAFTFCEAIPETEVSHRDACFGGFGKEFVVLARDRDIRKVEEMTALELKQVSNWCLLTPIKNAQYSCIKHSVGSFFWGGENNRQIAINFCNSLSAQYQNGCFEALTNNVKTYIKDKNYRREYCNEIPSSFKDYCLKNLL